jgi:hypothetical protein
MTHFKKQIIFISYRMAAANLNTLKARTANLVKELEEAREAEEMAQEMVTKKLELERAVAKEAEVERLTAQHAQAIETAVQAAQAEHKVAMALQKSRAHLLHESLNQLRTDEKAIIAALMEVQRRGSEVEEALIDVLNISTSEPSVINNATKTTLAAPMTTDTPLNQTPGIPQGTQFMLSDMGLKYLTPGGNVTTVAANVDVTVS